MIYIELRIKNCFVCREPIKKGERTISGHFKATNCESDYVAVLAAWHTGRCDAVAGARQADTVGCMGEYEDWMGVEFDHIGEASSWVNPQRKRR
jgi:hypothetical protein